jgi:hypothetical protein
MKVAMTILFGEGFGSCQRMRLQTRFDPKQRYSIWKPQYFSGTRASLESG